MKNEVPQEEWHETPKIPEEHTKEAPASASRREFLRTIGATAAAVSASSVFGAGTTGKTVENVDVTDFVLPKLHKDVFHNLPLPEVASFNPEARARLKEIVDKDYRRLKMHTLRNFTISGTYGSEQGTTLSQREKMMEDLAKKTSTFVEHPESIKVGDAEVRIIGVSHEPKTVIAHQRELENAIRDADAIFVEGTPHASRLGTPSDLARFASEHKLSANTAKRIEEWALENPFSQFFGHTELLAAKHGKPVITADPEAGGKGFYEMALWGSKNKETPLQDRDDAMLTLLLTGASASVLTGIATAISGQREGDKIAIEEGKPEKETGEKETNAKISDRKRTSRRKFLAGSLLSMFGLGATVALSPTIQVQDGVGPSGPISAGIIYNLIDYRNTVTAEALMRYVQTHQDKRRILVIYGNAHRIALAQYLQNPTFLSIKHKLYAPYRSQTTENIEEFRYQLFDEIANAGEPGKWVKTYEENLM
ncbi:MAG: hypothetical protein Q7S52_01010 [bacterium]|nr:hypothetical protein [bacterium]